jgi:transposase InsO family protein
MSFLRRRKNKVKVAPKEESTTYKPPKKRKTYPPEVKLLAIDAMEAGLTMSEVGELIGVSGSALGKWRKLYAEGGEKALMRQASNPGSRKICGELERRIEQMRRDNPEAGVRRIRDDLRRDQAIGVSAETVRRVVNDAGIGAPPAEGKRRPPQTRRFEREIPNSMWQIDIFTFELKRHYPVYLVGMIDDHSRYIVGHGLFRQQTAPAVLEVVKGAIGQWGAPREILSDNGRQFAAWRGETKFQKTLKRQGISHVRSAPHHPMTLGKIERFWKTIWTEFLEDAYFASFADACQRLDHWIGYYNHQRPHQGIDGLCPADRFYGVAEDVEEALKQGCRENALQLALGQETRPPLFLLGKLGETNVRVTRKGEDIEVKLGDEVHEVIRVGSPFRLDAQGRGLREEAIDEVEGPERGGEIPGGSDGEDRGCSDQGAVQDLWSESPDLEQRHGEGGSCRHGSSYSQESGPSGQDPGGAGNQGVEEGEGRPGQGPGPLETEVRDSHDLPGPPQEDAGWGAPARGGTGPESFTEAGEKKEASPSPEAEDYEDLWSGPDWNKGGPG